MKKGRGVLSKTKNGKFQLKVVNNINLNSIPFMYLTLIVLLINILIIIFIIVYSPNLPPQSPLYYGLPRGEKQLAPPLSLILPILISSLFVAVNSIIAYYANSKYLKNILVLAGLFISLLSVITVVQILLLNI
jgi:hypothetical protein